MQEHMDINKQIHDYGMWRERERERNTGEEDVSVELRREARGGGELGIL